MLSKEDLSKVKEGMDAYADYLIKAIEVLGDSTKRELEEIGADNPTDVEAALFGFVVQECMVYNVSLQNAGAFGKMIILAHRSLRKKLES